jgi:hypothetical protein
MVTGSPANLIQFSEASVGVVPKITSQPLPSTDFPMWGQICLLTVMLSLDSVGVFTDVVVKVQVIWFTLHSGYTQLCNCVRHSGTQAC